MVELKIDDNFPDDLEIYVSTSPKGLFIINKEKTYNPIKNESFGITYDFNDHSWFVFSESKIYKIKEEKIIHEIVLPQYCRGKLHQIDFLDDILYATVTVKLSEVLLMNPKENFKIFKKIIPIKKRHAHINSIFSTNGKIYMIAHNKTAQTGVESDLIIMDKKHNIIRKKENIGHSCHNYYTDGVDEFWCNSHKNSLMKNSKICKKFADDEFIRGMSISDDYILVGSSKLNEKRGLRFGSSGIVYILDKEFNIISVVEIEKCQIRDIRQSSHLDLTLSNTIKYTGEINGNSNT